MKRPNTEFSFPKMEQDLLSSWDQEKLFEKQNSWRKDAKEFSFYDGPPFANGLPHYGHLLASTIKDVVPRYWMMKGYYVNRRFGWDCHGLPVEFEIEKTHNLKGRPDILKMGAGKFNETCRSSVMKYTKDWQETIQRLGRWVDWNNQYRTMDKDFMESVWWVFQELFKKDLVYRGFKVVPYSPRTSSVVSNFEANQNYKDVQDPSITIKFKLKDDPRHILAWTTTPWTLPANLALAVGESIDYVCVRPSEAPEEEWILAKERLNAVFKKTEDYEILSQVDAKDLIGKSYEPLFPYFADQKNAFRIIKASYVTTDNGTGVVHQAPAFGEDDFYACKAEGIEFVDPIDNEGAFLSSVPDLEGTYFKDADKPICRTLKEQGKLLRHDTLVHSYPFDERTDTPLMYKAVPSWYVAVENFVDDLVKNNQEINWVPSHLKDGRMGTWLKNARDWSISRNRFWGTPLPVWVCNQDSEHFQVFGSIKELEKASGESITDLHRHKLSHIELPCQHCSGKSTIVDVVFDCWFESGAMPYAQIHHPFEDRKNFDEIFPANFVAEGLDQTRGWFYTLNVLSTALYNKPAFRNVIVNGIILSADGKKMSKRHRNYTPPMDLINTYGADSVRLHMLNSPLLRAEDLVFTDKGVKDTTRHILLPLYNAYSFLSTYAQAEQWNPEASLLQGKAPNPSHDLDRWVLSKLQSLVDATHKRMAEYKLYLVVPALIDFIDDLTNFYIRLSRRRFWGESKQGQRNASQEEAFATLTFVLGQFVTLLAPFAPFVADHLYRNLVDGNPELPPSVHLVDAPEANQELVNTELEEQMSLVKCVLNQGRALRQKHQLKTRQVLPKLMVFTSNSRDQNYIHNAKDLIASELNLKEVEFSSEEQSYVDLSLKPNLKLLGKKLGPKLKPIREAFMAMNQEPKELAKALATLQEGKSLEIQGCDIKEEEILVDRKPKDKNLISTDQGVTVLLDTTLTKELIQEGLAREVVNRVQNLRKDSGLDVSDRIKLHVACDKEIHEALTQNKSYVANETLALHFEIELGEAKPKLPHVEAFEIEKLQCIIGLEVDASKSV